MAGHGNLQCSSATFARWSHHNHIYPLLVLPSGTDHVCSAYQSINPFIAYKLHPYYKKESYTIQIHHNVEFECCFLLERVCTIAVSSVSTEEM